MFHSRRRNAQGVYLGNYLETIAKLEEGAGVVYEDKVYAGEAMFPYAAHRTHNHA